MVKQVLIRLVKLYQQIPFKSHSQCKYVPTCSNYALSVLNDFGAFKGSWLTFKRIIRCNPFTKGGIDLPPKKEKI